MGVATRVRAEGGSEGRTEPRGEGSVRMAGFLLPLREAGGLGSSPRAALNLRDPFPLLLGRGGSDSANSFAKWGEWFLIA